MLRPFRMLKSLHCSQTPKPVFVLSPINVSLRPHPRNRFSDALAKLRNTTVSFFVCLSVRMELLGSHRTDFYEIWYSIFRKLVEKIPVSLQSSKING